MMAKPKAAGAKVISLCEYRARRKIVEVVAPGGPGLGRGIRQPRGRRKPKVPQPVLSDAVSLEAPVAGSRSSVILELGGFRIQIRILGSDGVSLVDQSREDALIAQELSKFCEESFVIDDRIRPIK